MHYSLVKKKTPLKKIANNTEVSVYSSVVCILNNAASHQSNKLGMILAVKIIEKSTTTEVKKTNIVNTVSHYEKE